MVLSDYDVAVQARNDALLALPDDVSAFVRTFGADRRGVLYADLVAMGLEPLVWKVQATTVPWPYRLTNGTILIEPAILLDVTRGRALVPSEIHTTLRELTSVSH